MPKQTPETVDARERGLDWFEEWDTEFQRICKEGRCALKRAQEGIEELRREQDLLWRLTGGRRGYPYDGRR